MEMLSVEELEALIDREGVSRVLDMLSEICCAKSAHIQDTWQDDRLASVWYNAGREIEILADSLDI